MIDSYFYHGTIKKIETAFVYLFNGISVKRFDSNNVEVQRITVPISYGPKEKWYTRLVQDPDFEKKVQLILPRMGYELSSMTYDPVRKLSTLMRTTKTVDHQTRSYSYTYVPYNFNFNLYIQARNIDDGNQILEQILPFFTPAYNLKINLIPDLDLKENVPFILTAVTKQDEYEGDFEKVRNLLWILTFTAKAKFYGPIFEQGVIKSVQVDTHIGAGEEPWTADEMAHTARHVRQTFEPSPSSAEAEDDYVVDETLQEFDDGKIFDPTTLTDVDIPE